MHGLLLRVTRVRLVAVFPFRGLCLRLHYVSETRSEARRLCRAEFSFFDFCEFSFFCFIFVAAVCSGCRRVVFLLFGRRTVLVSCAWGHLCRGILGEARGFVLSGSWI